MKIDNVLYCLESLAACQLADIEDGVIDIHFDDDHEVSHGCEIEIPDLAKHAIKVINELSAKIEQLTT